MNQEEILNELKAIFGYLTSFDEMLETYRAGYIVNNSEIYDNTFLAGKDKLETLIYRIEEGV